MKYPGLNAASCAIVDRQSEIYCRTLLALTMMTCCLAEGIASEILTNLILASSLTLAQPFLSNRRCTFARPSYRFMTSVNEEKAPHSLARIAVPRTGHSYGLPFSKEKRR